MPRSSLPHLRQYPPSPPTTPSRVPSRPGVSGFAFPSADPTQIFCNAYESSNLPNKPELCDAFCEPVINLVNEVVDAQLMGTQLEATIRMNGLNCMYAFCGAVVFSLILGVVCDYIDDDYRRHREVRPKLSHYIDLVHLKDGLSDDWHLGGVLGLGMLRSPLSFLHLTLLIITLGACPCSNAGLPARGCLAFSWPELKLTQPLGALHSVRDSDLCHADDLPSAGWLARR